MKRTHTITGAELLALPPSTPQRRGLALARDAVKILEREPDRVGSATWRLADALVLLSEGHDDLPGIDYPTVSGAQLMKVKPHSEP